MRALADFGPRRAGARLAASASAILGLFEPSPYAGFRPTPRRYANLWVNRIEHRWRRTRLLSRPYKLIVEPINACNLRCPYCFTGAGGHGRVRSTMSTALYDALLRELGDYLLEIEAFNWGEPLLNPDIFGMIEAASARGIATKLNTNFSLPFDAAHAERLVRAGLTTLTVSIDGAEQRTYERYRVRGDLATALANCRLVRDAKRRLGSPTPHLNLEFHVFPHNAGDHAAIGAIASELGMTLLVFKGTAPGPEWEPNGPWKFCVEPQPMPCASLWAFAVVHNDGGVAPCNGTFYREDDMGTLGAGATELTLHGFRAVWNGPRYRAARRFYRRRDGSAADREHVCFDCPQTRIHENWTRHVAAGGTGADFALGYTTNDGWQYFWNRRPQRPGVHELAAVPNAERTRRPIAVNIGNRGGGSSTGSR